MIIAMSSGSIASKNSRNEPNLDNVLSVMMPEIRPALRGTIPCQPTGNGPKWNPQKVIG